MRALVAAVACLCVVSAFSVSIDKGKDNDNGDDRADVQALVAFVVQQNEMLMTLGQDVQVIRTKMNILLDPNLNTPRFSNIDSQLQAIKDQLVINQKDMKSGKLDVQILQQQMEGAKEDIEAVKSAISQMRISQKDMARYMAQKYKVGSTYIRWGSKKCPEDTEKVKNILVYSGVVGGKHSDQQGSGTNPLCLTDTPIYDQRARPTTVAQVYGSQYKDVSDTLQHKDVPCAVCHTDAPSTIMVPGTHQCPQGFVAHYDGYLSSAPAFHHASQYVCLDRHAQAGAQSSQIPAGILLTMAVSRCNNTLPCPPYVDDAVITCVVCSRCYKGAGPTGGMGMPGWGIQANGHGRGG